ncbi:Molybdenum transport ATP-binding protein ModC (TC 3.A.1.8.1) [plant metagenome]|uniref:Molybdenum transport ATP-binding protein ModC (TC 3.A.1.8.1) n=1 Tax=plant metagenome TaxID=1297885 RepID=A0A484S935_9ZZZZ
MIDVDIRLHVQDGKRHFDLSARFQAEAQVVALYGPSGAGKSLTLQALAGLLRPSAGHIRMGGRTLFDAAAGIDLPPRQRKLGYLFQDYALFPHLSVRQNVWFGLTDWLRRRPQDADAARVDALLESFGLSALADSRPATLSGGQRQRVALARALACEPQALLLDEPFAALNPMLRASLRQELALIGRQWGIPMVMITHDVEDVIALADLAFVYEAGTIVQRIDLHTATSQEAARSQLDPSRAQARTPRQLRLRALLGAPD